MEMEGKTRNLRKERVGIVTSNKMDKSIVVSVERKQKHPIYGKFIKPPTSFMHTTKRTSAMKEIRCVSWKPVQ